MGGRRETSGLSLLVLLPAAASSTDRLRGWKESVRCCVRRKEVAGEGGREWEGSDGIGDATGGGGGGVVVGIGVGGGVGDGVGGEDGGCGCAGVLIWREDAEETARGGGWPLSL